MHTFLCIAEKNPGYLFPVTPGGDNSLFSGLASQIGAAMGCEENCRMNAFFTGLSLGLVGLRSLVALWPLTFHLQRSLKIESRYLHKISEAPWENSPKTVRKAA